MIVIPGGSLSSISCQKLVRYKFVRNRLVLAEKAAAAATVTVSADGTQMQIKDASGYTATSITTDIGVTITMDEEPIAIAMENLAVGALQRATTATGETLVARKASADDEMPTYYNEDGTPATKADGQPYTTEDLVALTLVFEG